MRQITKTQKISIFLIIANLIMISVLCFWYSSIWSSVYKITEKKTLIKGEAFVTESLTDLKKQKNTANEMIDFFEAISIDKENVVGFIELLEKMAEKSGTLIDIQTVNLANSFQEDNKSLDSLKVNLQVRGSWKQVMNFILMLENNPYYLVIENTRINSINDDGFSGWSAMISLVGVIN